MNEIVFVAPKIAGRFLQRLAHITAWLLPAGLLAMSTFGAFSHPAHAESTLSAKLSPELANAIEAQVLPRVNWAKDTGNGRFFKVIVVGAGVDPVLLDLRNAVAAAGGAVNYRYQSIQGFSATIPGPALEAIALRPIDNAATDRRRRPRVFSNSRPERTQPESSPRWRPDTMARAWVSRSSIRGSLRSTSPSSLRTAARPGSPRWST
jgi:hypothetical protein